MDLSKIGVLFRLIVLTFLFPASSILAQNDMAAFDPGDDCQNPLPILIESLDDLPVETGNTTCGRGNQYANTCLQSYDGGEEIIYEITIGVPMFLDFVLDPKESPWTGMALSYDCPPTGSVYDDCLAVSVSQAADPHAFIIDLDPGVYYLMIDSWPPPDCIPEFELTILHVIIPPPKCQIAPIINMPEESPYVDSNQYTCGRYDDYDATCMQQYDGGEEMIYEIAVSLSSVYYFELDPRGTTYTGMALGLECPPPGTEHQDCYAISTSNSAVPHGFEVLLEVGTYYLMIDTWPSPECIPDYDLTVFQVLLPYNCGDANGDTVVAVNDAVWVINYVFAGGDPPDPLMSGDCNCDGVVNVSDSVWIINYIFAGGYQPCDIDGDGESDC